MNPKGGKPGNSGGKKGRSGRKSLAVEKQTLDTLEDLWLEAHNYEELRAKVQNASIPRSARDLWLAKLQSGKDVFIQALFERLYPKELKLNMKGEMQINLQEIRHKMQSYVPPHRRRHVEGRTS